MLLPYKFLAAGWAMIILALTLIPGKAIPQVPVFGIDKVVHFLIFGILMFLTLRAFKKPSDLLFNPVMVSGLFCIGYGILIEFLQNYIPGRSYSIYDIIANTIGVGLGYLAYILFMRNRAGKKK